MSQEFFSRLEAANRQRCNVRTIDEWREKGWLISAAEKPFRCTAEALDEAAAKAIQSQREGQGAAKVAKGERYTKYAGAGRISIRDAAKRLNVSRNTVLRWLFSCPYLPHQRSIKHWPEENDGKIKYAFYVAEKDISTIERKTAGDVKAEAYKRTLPFRRAHARRIRPAAIAKRYPKLKEGEGNIFDACGWAGAPASVIRHAVKNGELEPTSQKPLRLDRDAVKSWAQTKTKDDLAITEIPARLETPEGKILKSGESQKLSRIRNIIKRKKIPTYLRIMPGRRVPGQKCRVKCIRIERFAEIKEEYLAIVNGEGDELRPDEIKVHKAAREHKRSRKTILDLLAKHAPGCIRIVTLKTSNGARHECRVAPRAAIEAALRGENWTPAAANEAEVPPAATKPAAKESETTPARKLPDPVAASNRVQLFGPDCPPAIDGEMMPKLARLEYRIVLALIEASEGVSAEQLAEVAGCESADSARNRFNVLKRKHTLWNEVLLPSGTERLGYRIL